jgi:hypothetical protein
MAHLSEIGECFICHKTVSFHPDRVARIHIDDYRKPICRECVESANLRRKANGGEPIRIVPGAYDPQEEV